jgi:hypothetical protein
MSEICEGSRVKISGLKARPDLNDQYGTAKTLDVTSGRWVVQVRYHELTILCFPTTTFLLNVVKLV